MADHKGKPPWNLFCDAQKGTNPAYRDGYERTFGKKPLPHGRDRVSLEDADMVVIEMDPDDPNAVQTLANIVAAYVGEDPDRCAGSA